MYTIYQIRNIVNGNLYVGSAKMFRRRKLAHIGLLNKNKHHSRYLQNAWNKYGNENFIFEVIREVEDETKVFEIENAIIVSLKPEYNVMIDVFSHIGLKRSKETCKRISDSLTGRKLSSDHIESMRKANIGKTQSVTTVKKRIKNNYKKVAAYNKRTGKLFKIFESATHAAKELKCSRKPIYGAMNNYKYKKTYKGYIWKKVENLELE